MTGQICPIPGGLRSQEAPIPGGRRMGHLVLGVNSVYHESSACLLDGARVLAFCEEERFTREKRAKRLTIDNADVLPERAMEWCLATAGASWADVGRVAYSYDPDVRPPADPDPAEDVRPGSWGSPDGEAVFQRTVRGVPGVLSKLAGTDLTDRFRWVPHHRAHAASAYFAAPFESAAVLSVDALGEVHSTGLYAGRGPRMETLREIAYPHSLGFLWETVSEFLGLDRYTGPAKVMGLAAFGRPDRFAAELARLLLVGPADFQVDNSLTRFRSYGPNKLHSLFGEPRVPRAEGEAVTVQGQRQHALLDVGYLAVARQVRGPVPGLARLEPPPPQLQRRLRVAADDEPAGAAVWAVPEHRLQVGRDQPDHRLRLALDQPRQRDQQRVRDLDQRLQGGQLAALLQGEQRLGLHPGPGGQALRAHAVRGPHRPHGPRDQRG